MNWFRSVQHATEDEKTTADGEINVLEDTFQTYIDSGYLKNSPETVSKVVDCIKEARTFTEKGNTFEAGKCVSGGYAALKTDIYSKSIWWRIVFIHQIPLFLYFTAVSISLLYVTIIELKCVSPSLYILSLTLGSIGAVLRGLWFLHIQVAKEVFRSSSITAHLFAPIIGALFGFFSLLLFQAGILVAENKFTSTEIDIKFLLPFFFLSGFSWEWIMSKIELLKSK